MLGRSALAVSGAVAVRGGGAPAQQQWRSLLQSLLVRRRSRLLSTSRLNDARHNLATAQLLVSNLNAKTTVDELRSAVDWACAIKSVEFLKEGAVVSVEREHVSVAIGVLDGLELGGSVLSAAHREFEAPPSPREINSLILDSDGSSSGIMKVYSEHGLHFDAVNFSTAMNRLAKVDQQHRIPHTDVRVQAMLKRSVESMQKNPSAWNPVSMTALAWGTAKIGVKAPSWGVFKAIAEIGLAPTQEAGDWLQINDYKPRELPTIAWAFATAGAEEWRFMEEVGRCAALKVKRFNAQDLSNLAWAFCKAEIKAPEMYAAIAVESTRLAPTFNAQNLANTAWSFAMMRVDAPLLMDAIAEQALPRLNEFNCKNLTDLAWSLAKAQRPGSGELHKAIAKCAAPRLAEFTPQNLSLMAWAVARSGEVAAPDLFVGIAKQAVRRIGAFSTRDLARIALVYASPTAARDAITTTDRDALYRGILKASVTKTYHFHASELADLGACAALTSTSGGSLNTPVLFKVLRTRVSPSDILGPAFNRTQSLANLATAFTRSNNPGSHMQQGALAKAVVRRIAEFSGRELSQLAFAFASARQARPLIYRAITGELLSGDKLSTMKARDLAQLAWALASVGSTHVPKETRQALLREIASFATPLLSNKKFDPADLTSIAWSMTVTGVLEPAFFEALTEETKRQLGEFLPHSLSQFHQVKLELLVGEIENQEERNQRAGNQAPHHKLLKLLSRYEEELASAFLADEPSPSRSHEEIQASMLRINWPFDLQHVAENEGMVLDFARVDSKVAFEFAGPWHYAKQELFHTHDKDAVLAQIRKRPPPFESRTQLKRRFLSSRGWRVYYLPYYDWAMLKTDFDRDLYLINRIRGALGDEEAAKLTVPTYKPPPKPKPTIPSLTDTPRRRSTGSSTARTQRRRAKRDAPPSSDVENDDSSSSDNADTIIDAGDDLPPSAPLPASASSPPQVSNENDDIIDQGDSRGPPA